MKQTSLQHLQLCCQGAQTLQLCRWCKTGDRLIAGADEEAAYC